MDFQPQIVSGYVPKYRQLVNILRDRILTGEFSPGDRLPSEEELSLAYDLSRGTVRKAIAQLEAERLVSTEQGVGCFVRSMHPRAVPFHLTEPQGAGPSLTYQVLAQEVIPAPLDAAERLRIPPGEPVIHIVRRRLSQGRVTAYTVRYLPEALCPSIVHEDLAGQSVHELLVSNSELPLLRAEVEIEAHSLTAEEAGLLDAEPGSAAVVVERLTYTAPNRPAVWYRGLFRRDYHFGVALEGG
jgi:DNA-binding GntR family transcriptional regulator